MKIEKLELEFANTLDSNLGKVEDKMNEIIGKVNGMGLDHHKLRSVMKRLEENFDESLNKEKCDCERSQMDQAIDKMCDVRDEEISLNEIRFRQGLEIIREELLLDVENDRYSRDDVDRLTMIEKVLGIKKRDKTEEQVDEAMSYIISVGDRDKIVDILSNIKLK